MNKGGQIKGVYMILHSASGSKGLRRNDAGGCGGEEKTTSLESYHGMVEKRGGLQ